MQSFDVVIAGGGMVGLATAAALQGSGLRIAVVEHRIPELAELAPEPALRVSAINAASERLLQHLGVWQDILALRASAYQGMEVWDSDSFGRIAFRAQEYGHTHLGHIIENSVIQQALWNKVARQSEVTMIAPATFQQVAWERMKRSSP